MNQKIEELVKFVETGISVALCSSCGGVGSTCENDCPAPTTQSLCILAKQILSHPDLALIDSDSYDGMGMHPVIPLAEALKEK